MCGSSDVLRTAQAAIVPAARYDYAALDRVLHLEKNSMNERRGAKLCCSTATSVRHFYGSTGCRPDGVIKVDERLPEGSTKCGADNPPGAGSPKLSQLHPSLVIICRGFRPFIFDLRRRCRGGVARSHFGVFRRISPQPRPTRASSRTASSTAPSTSLPQRSGNDERKAE